MNWINKLERKFGRYSIKNLICYVIGLNALVFVFAYLNGVGTVVGTLILDPYLVLQGQVWRLVTYLFIPPTFSLIWIIFTLYFYYMVGSGLEQEWGAFKFNLYYLIGMAGTTAASFITGAGATGVYLNLSLFLAFAHIYPDFQILLFFILPVKVKYLAWLNWAVIGYTVVFMPIPFKAAAAAAVANYFIFFGKDIYRSSKLKRQVQRNRKRYFSEIEKAGRGR